MRDSRFSVPPVLRAAFFAAVLVAIAAQASSAGEIVLDKSRDTYPLSPVAEYMIEKEPVEASSLDGPPWSGRFSPADPGARQFPKGDRPVWARFKLRKARGDAGDRVIETQDWSTSFTLYVPVPDGTYRAKRVDAKGTYERRGIPDRGLVLALPGDFDSSRYFYIRTEPSPYPALILEFSIWEKEAFYRWRGDFDFVQALYMGFILVMAVYNLFLFLSIRESRYLYYVLYIATIGMWQFTFYNYGLKYLWPGSPGWNYYAPAFFLSLFTSFLMLFANQFLEMKKHSPRVSWLLNILAGLFLVYGALAAVDLALGMKYFYILALVTGATAVYAIIMGLMKNRRATFFFLVACSAFTVGAIVKVLSDMGALPVNFLTQTGVQLGSSIEIVLLSLALADRINVMNRRLKEQAESLGRLDRLKDQFLANTSHELRTPLNGIIGIAESLIDGAAGTVSAAMKQNLSLVVSSGKRLASLVNDILDFSRLRNRDIELTLKPVDLAQIVQVVLAVSKPLVHGKDLELVNNVDRDIPAVTADENRLEQILHNLVGNAIKFTERGSVAVGARVENSRVYVSVKDTGIGIPADRIGAIFESFEQVDASTQRVYGGTGLGLSITKDIIELHGGEITARSETGKGSEFTFWLKASEKRPDARTGLRMTRLSDIDETERAEEPVAPGTPAAGPGAARVLVVDDEPVNRRVLINLLGLQNYEVLEATNGEEALKLVKTARPDIMLLDIMMPVMNGYDVCRRLREEYSLSELPVIMLTAKNQVRDLVEGMNSGANDYLPKPFSRHELLSRMRTHLSLYQFNSAVSRFVPRNFMAQLEKQSILDVKLGDQIQKEMTVLFSDIRDFTSISEGMTPQENFNFINSYLERMGPAIENNNGFIDKYIGDAIMALFPGDPSDAVKAAIMMQKSLAGFNARGDRGPVPPVAMGIGIHTGSLMLGTVGYAERMEGTVIADSVNLTSRVEGLTKLYGATIMVTADLLERLGGGGEYRCRLLDEVQVKGKNKSVLVYEIIDGEPPEVIEKKLATKDMFAEALNAYRAGDFTGAKDLFGGVIESNPGDRAARLFRERCEYYEIHGMPPDWQGVIAMDHK